MAPNNAETDASQAASPKKRRTAHAVAVALVAVSIAGIGISVVSSAARSTSEAEIVQRIASDYKGVEQVKRGGVKNTSLIVTTGGVDVTCLMPSEDEVAHGEPLVCDHGRVTINAKD